MKCENCGKREATTHMTRIVNGHKEEYHLCSECAAQSTEYKEIKSSMNFGIGDFLTGMFAGGKQIAEASPSADVCTTCHMPYGEFLKKGKLGCGDCYTSFADRLKRPLKQVHGTAEHIGKVPKRCGGELLKERRIEALEAELNAVVLKQDFETAAKIRDEIRDIKAKRNEQE